MTVTEPAAEPTPSETNESDNALTWPSASDIPDAVEEETTETEPVQESTETTTETPEPEATEEPATETPAEPTRLEDLPEHWQTELTKARDQAADYRVKAREYHDAFEGYDEPTRDKFLELARGMADESKHVETAREFVAIGRRVLEAYGEDVSKLVGEDPDRPMTKAEVEAELEAREQRAAEERATQESIQAIAAEVKELGYTEGSPDHYALLRLANDREDGSLAEAHKQVEAWKKSVIDEWAKSFQQKQERHLATAPAVGVAPSDPGEEPPVDFKGARARLDQYLSDIQQ